MEKFYEHIILVITYVLGLSALTLVRTHSGLDSYYIDKMIYVQPVWFKRAQARNFGYIYNQYPSPYPLGLKKGHNSVHHHLFPKQYERNYFPYSSHKIVNIPQVFTSKIPSLKSINTKNMEKRGHYSFYRIPHKQAYPRNHFIAFRNNIPTTFISNKYRSAVPTLSPSYASGLVTISTIITHTKSNDSISLNKYTTIKNQTQSEEHKARNEFYLNIANDDNGNLINKTIPKHSSFKFQPFLSENKVVFLPTPNPVESSNPNIFTLDDVIISPSTVIPAYVTATPSASHALLLTNNFVDNTSIITPYTTVTNKDIFKPMPTQSNVIDILNEQMPTFTKPRISIPSTPSSTPKRKLATDKIQRSSKNILIYEKTDKVELNDGDNKTEQSEKESIPTVFTSTAPSTYIDTNNGVTFPDSSKSAIEIKSTMTLPLTRFVPTVKLKTDIINANESTKTMQKQHTRRGVVLRFPKLAKKTGDNITQIQYGIEKTNKTTQIKNTERTFSRTYLSNNKTRTENENNTDKFLKSTNQSPANSLILNLNSTPESAVMKIFIGNNDISNRGKKVALPKISFRDRYRRKNQNRRPEDTNNKTTEFPTLPIQAFFPEVIFNPNVI